MNLVDLRFRNTNTLLLYFFPLNINTTSVSLKIYIFWRSNRIQNMCKEDGKFNLG